MSHGKEADVIARTRSLATRSSLRTQLTASGVQPGDTILVHTSLSALGWIAGGAVALIQALRDCVGANGTLVVPSHTGLTDPAGWIAPAIPAEWVCGVRSAMPAYDPGMTPTRGMGVVAELFRTLPGVKCSVHPNTSFAAIGWHAGRIVADHALESPLGERSPLAKLYDLNATVLLLGVGFEACTMLHLAEQRAWPHRPTVAEGAPLLVEGVRRWVSYEAPPLMDPDGFKDVGDRLLSHGVARCFAIGGGMGMTMPSRDMVDRAVDHWGDMAPMA